MTRANEGHPMDVSSEGERRILAGARAGLSPSPADAARIRQLLAPALAAGAAGWAVHPSSARSAAGVARGWSWGRRLLAGASIATAAAAGGYRLGHRAGLREASAIVAGGAPTAVAVEAPTTSAPVELPRAEPPLSTTPTARPIAGPVASSRKRSPAAPANTVPSLEQEVRALRAVERALRDGSPGLALALLGELDRAVPDGHLMEERAATATIARCSLGQAPFGVDLAETFEDQHPGSVYAKRVRQACEKPPAR